MYVSRDAINVHVIRIARESSRSQLSHKLHAPDVIGLKLLTSEIQRWLMLEHDRNVNDSEHPQFD